MAIDPIENETRSKVPTMNDRKPLLLIALAVLVLGGLGAGFFVFASRPPCTESLFCVQVMADDGTPRTETVLRSSIRPRFPFETSETRDIQRGPLVDFSWRDCEARLEELVQSQELEPRFCR